MEGTTTTSRIHPDSGQLGSSRRNCGPSSELPWRCRGGAGTSEVMTAALCRELSILAEIGGGYVGNQIAQRKR